MEDWKKNIATGALSLLVGSIALQLLPEIQTSSDLIDALNNPLARLLLLMIIIYVLISGAVNWLSDLLSKESDTRESYTPYSGDKPETRTVVGEVRYAGVNWPFMWGETGDQYHGWVDRPNCSTCGTGLDSDTVRRRVRSDKKIWECPACAFSTDRIGVVDQRESVQQIVENEGSRIIQSLIATKKNEVESMLNEIEERAEIDLNFQQSNHEMTNSDQESLEEAIEEVVDEDDLQNQEKVLVLDHLLDRDYGPKDQYDVLWWETYEPGVQKAIDQMS